MAIAYISWAPHCSRSDYTASELGGRSHMVYWTRLGSHWSTVWLKYLGQAVRTWWILFRDKPDAVFVMSPPVVAGLVVYSYCALRRVPFVVDAHTGAFMDKRWRHFQKMQLWLCRMAATTIVTNTFLSSMLERNGADTTILPDVPVRYPPSNMKFDKPVVCIAVICSFDYDEPVQVILDTARAIPEATFLVTGDPAKVERMGLVLPANFRLTGFLENAAYGHLLREADVVMALTTGKHKMLRAAYEAIYQGTPIIISDSPMLREEFPRGGLIVDNSPEVIAAAVRTVVANRDTFKQEVEELRAQKEHRWQRNKEILMSKIGLTSQVHPRV